jgi:hypothetical protein
LGITHSDQLGAAVPSSYYEIRVVGVIPPEALLDFERLTASIEPVETVLHGPLRDQAALHGLLARLETFGVEVMEVRRFHHDPPTTDGQPGE